MKSVTSNIGKAGAGPWAISRFQAHTLAARFGQPARFDLESIIEDAWKWECKVCPPSLVEPKQLRA